MTHLKCELCGSTDLIKRSGLFVCQGCGCKYTLEEARKLMTTDRQGTDACGENPGNEVTSAALDSAARASLKTGPWAGSGGGNPGSSKDVDQLYEKARDALMRNDTADASAYYMELFDMDPRSWEAAFYTAFLSVDSSGRTFHEVSMGCALRLLREQTKDPARLLAEIQKAVEICIRFNTSRYETLKEDWSLVECCRTDLTRSDMLCTAERMYALGDAIHSVFEDEPQEIQLAVTVWKDGIQKHKGILPYFRDGAPLEKRILEYAARVQRYDRSFRVSRLSLRLRSLLS